jgi:hypothetical protein
MTEYKEKLKKIDLKLLAIRRSLRKWNVLGQKITGRDQQDIESKFQQLEDSLRVDIGVGRLHFDDEMNRVNIQLVNDLLDLLKKYESYPQIGLVIQYVEEAKEMFEKLYG